MTIEFVAALDYKGIEDGYAIYSRDLLDALRKIAAQRGTEVRETLIARNGSPRFRSWRFLRATVAGHSHFFADYRRSLDRDTIARLATADLLVANHYRALVALRAAGVLDACSAPVLYVAHNVESAALLSDGHAAVRAGRPSGALGLLGSPRLRAEERSLLCRCAGIVTLTAADATRITKLAPGRPVVVAAPVARPGSGSSSTGATRLPSLTLGLSGSFYWRVKRTNLAVVSRALDATTTQPQLLVIGTGLELAKPAVRYRHTRWQPGFADAARLLDRCDALVLPERQASGMKLKALEALTLGHVAIAHRNAVDGIPDTVLRHWYVYERPRELRLIVDGLTRSDLRERRAAVTRVRQAALEKFSRPHFEGRLAEALRLVNV